MNLRNILRGIAIVIWSAVVLTSVNRAVSPQHSSRSLAHHGEAISNCSDLDIRFENRHAVVESEERTITKSEAPTLRIQPDTNSGLHVEGWDRDTYSLILCKAADPAHDAQDILSKIHLTFQNGQVYISGPAHDDRWSAHLILKTPKAASLDLQVHNGPVGLHSVDGNARVHAINGPIDVTDCSGDIDLSAANGPVTLERNSGKLRVDAQNGPLTLSLEGRSWTGAGIEAHANNGPLSLRIPEGYQTGVLVESDGHSPFRCHASVCSEAHKAWDDDRKSIQFGSGPTMIHLSTVNGPVSVN